MSRFRVVAVACCLVFTTFSANARTSTGGEGSVCASPEQLRAAQVRQMHNQLQVAALNCRADDASLREKWSAYVNRFSSTMAENAQVLRGLFKTPAGFDRYNTKVTNRESVRVHEIEDYCATRSQMFDQVMTMGPTQLADFAAATIGAPEHVRSCQKSTPRQASHKNTATDHKSKD